MKLSAPPPPPPEPNEQPAPDAPPDPTSAAPDAPPVKPAPKLATWPGWLGGADAAVALLAVVLAFLVASFAARNTDVWIHLAAGKMLTTGEYKLGSDPFSYTGADRAWVNHSWLFDLGLYLLYSGTGFTLVLLKALAVATAAGLLLALRRSNYPLWPWALCVTLFVLAAGPRLTLTPLVGSVLFFAATLFMVFKLPAKRLPVAVGVLFGFWANVDQWFFVGPLALALLLVGEVLHQKFLVRYDGDTDAPLPLLPAVPVLAKALAIGVVACMLNPHHVRVWELPFELVGSSVGKADAEIARGLLISPLDGVYSERADLGYNINGLAYAILLVAGGVTLGFGVGRLRISHLLLWLGFAVMSLLTVYAIPFFAAAAVPLIAAQLNALSARVKLGARSSPGTRLLVVGSAVGRCTAVIGLVVLCVCAWPGWLQPFPYEPAAARRVAWAVEPDQALMKAADQLKAWREKGDLPADARGMIVSMQFANLCAWFAPGEKVFINGRYNHHRAELPDYLAIRLALGLRTRDGPPDPREAAEILAKNKAEYVGYSDSQRRNGPAITFALWAGWDNWASWYTDGRSAVFGWRASPGKETPTFEKLRLDAVSLAIGRDAIRLPTGKAQPVPLPRQWEDDFTRPIRQTPPEIDEAFGWLDYRQSRGVTYNAQQEVGRWLFFSTPSPQGDSFHQFAAQYMAATGQVGRVPPRGDAFVMAPVLALRAARRAIAANPDHPDGYYVLAQVLEDPSLPMTEIERRIAIITAYRQCLERLPKPDEMRRQLREYNRKLYIASPTHVSFTLAQLHMNVTDKGQVRGLVLEDDPLRSLAAEPVRTREGQVVGFRFLPWDVIHALLLQTADYAAIEVVGGEEADRKRFLDQVKNFTKTVEDQLRQRRDAMKGGQGQSVKPAERYRRAKQLELSGEAIGILKGMKGEELVKEFGQGVIQTLLELVALEICAGQLENAAADLADLKEAFGDLTRSLDPAMQNALRMALRMLDHQKMLLEGDYAGAGTELEARVGKDVGLEPLMEELKKLNIDTRPLNSLGGAWPTVPMLGAQHPVEVVAMYWNGRMQFELYTAARAEIAQKLQLDSAFFYRRGFLSLIEADIPATKERFRQSRREPPTGWNLPTFVHPSADNYLRMIEAAEKK